MAGKDQIIEGFSSLKSLDVSLDTMGSHWRMLMRRMTWSYFSFRQIVVTTWNEIVGKSLEGRNIKRLLPIFHVRGDKVSEEDRNRRHRERVLS